MAGQDPRDHADSVELIDLPEREELEEEYVPEVAPIDNAAQEAEAEKARAQEEGGDQLPRRLFTAAIPPVPPPGAGRKQFTGGDDGAATEAPAAGDPAGEPEGDDDENDGPQASSPAPRAADGPPAPVASRTSPASPWARRPENGS